MRIKTTASELKSALAKFAGTIPPKPSLPALACLLVKGKEDGSGVTMTGTNTDITIVAEMSCAVESPESAAIPYRLLSAAVDMSEAGAVTLETKGDSVIVTTKTGTSRISTINPEFFPAIPKLDATSSFAIPCTVLESMLSRVTFAAATPEQARKALENTLIEVADGEIRAVATNGLALALVKHPMKNPTSEKMEMLVPAKSGATIRKLLAGDEVSVIVPKDGSCAVFEMKGITIRTKLCEDKYPDYRRVIPDISDLLFFMSASKDATIAAVKRTTLFSTVGENVYTRCDFNANEIVFTANAAGVGDVKEVLVPYRFEGKDTTSFFNSWLLISALSSVSSDTADISKTKQSSPIIVSDATGYMALIMPIRRD